MIAKKGQNKKIKQIFERNELMGDMKERKRKEIKNKIKGRNRINLKKKRKNTFKKIYYRKVWYEISLDNAVPVLEPYGVWGTPSFITITPKSTLAF